MIIDYRFLIMSGIKRFTKLGHFSTWSLSLLGKTERFNIFIVLLIPRLFLGKNISSYSFLKSQGLNLLFSYSYFLPFCSLSTNSFFPIVNAMKKRSQSLCIFSDLINTGYQQESIITTNIYCAVILCKILR